MRRKRSGRVALWLLAAALLAVLGLCWFDSNRSKQQRLPAIQPVSHASPNPEPAAHRSTSSRANLTEPTGPAPSPKPPAGSPEEPLASRPTLDATNDVGPLPPSAATNAPTISSSYPRPVQNVFEMQVALARLALSPGSIDGLLGPQTRSALRAFQQKEHLSMTGELDNATRERLLLSEPPTGTYLVTSNDLARLQPLSSTWLGKSRQTALEYETVLELVSEKSQAAPTLVQRLNPDIVWSNVSACAPLELPNISLPESRRRAAFITIGLSDKVLEAWDERTNLLVHFPCSIARQVDKRPVGELHVTVVALNPNYTFDPEIFPESAEARELKTKLVLPPGPNNPVGVAWIGLDRPGYGIHGTPRPEQVGRTESHGCFRLANWNAAYVARLVSVGTPVYIQP
ncbi:MAG TPA: L,D-transpeptidase family protein [Verrucomicrobiae bacterium]|nr:L,D-transpeptidase family protein [Verrucomicrobiae bacterium]